MKQSELNELRRLFGLFMSEYDLNAKNFTQRNETAKLIKDKLKEVGRWRNLSRGKFKRKERIKDTYSVQQKERKVKKMPDDCPF